jgi:hypothetical protein
VTRKKKQLNTYAYDAFLLKNYAACSFGLSATSQQYFSLRTNQPPAASQQYFSLRTNQHQPSATSQTNRLWLLVSQWTGGAVPLPDQTVSMIDWWNNAMKEV